MYLKRVSCAAFFCGAGIATGEVLADMIASKQQLSITVDGASTAIGGRSNTCNNY